MTDNLSVIKSEGGAVAPLRPIEPSIGQMLEAVLKGNITAETANVVERLAPLMKQEREHNAKMAFTEDFVKMQAEMRKVRATKEVKTKEGTVKYKVAPVEDIDAQARPIYQKFNFAVSFSEGARQPGLVTAICRLMHVKGHSEDYPYTVRIGAGPHGASETQADTAAHTSAQRTALCSALNIVIGHQEDDANNLGAEITPEQVKDLQVRVKVLHVNEVQFLAYAKAKTYSEIVTTAYDRLDEWLTIKENAARASLKKRVLAAGGDLQDLATSSGVSSFDEIPATALESVAEIVRKMDGK